MIDEIIKDIAKSLKAVWNDRNVYSEEIPEGSENSFFIDVEEISFKRLTGNGKEITVALRVYYLCDNSDGSRNLRYFDFAENMTALVDTVAVGGRERKTSNHKAERNDTTYRFSFDLTFAVNCITKEQLMEKLYIKQEV
jgi:hypothetical protein